MTTTLSFGNLAKGAEQLGARRQRIGVPCSGSGRAGPLSMPSPASSAATRPNGNSCSSCTPRPDHEVVVRELIDEASHQGALADAGLTLDPHDS